MMAAQKSPRRQFFFSARYLAPARVVVAAILRVGGRDELGVAVRGADEVPDVAVGVDVGGAGVVVSSTSTWPLSFWQ